MAGMMNPRYPAGMSYFCFRSEVTLMVTAAPATIAVAVTTMASATLQWALAGLHHFHADIQPLIGVEFLPQYGCDIAG